MAKTTTPKYGHGKHYQPTIGETAANAQKQSGGNFTHGPGMENWTWSGQKWAPAPTSGGGSGGGGGLSTSPSMAALSGSGGMGGADTGGGGAPTGGAGSLMGPSKFRQGIGSRIPPQYTQSLAALRQVY